MASGIYQIVNTVNNKRYIGCATNLQNRKSTHFKNLRLNSHINKYLQNAWNKYGEDSFVFEVLEYCEKSVATELEQKHIDSHPFDQLYNILKKAGRLIPEETWNGVKIRLRDINKKQDLSRFRTKESQEKARLALIKRFEDDEDLRNERLNKIKRASEKTYIKSTEVDDNGVEVASYLSIKEVMEKYGVGTKTVDKMLSGLIKTPDGNTLIANPNNLPRRKLKRSQSGENNTFYNLRHSNESKEKIGAQTKKRHSNPEYAKMMDNNCYIKTRKVVQEIFPCGRIIEHKSIAAAAESLHTTKYGIHRIISGNQILDNNRILKLKH